MTDLYNTPLSELPKNIAPEPVAADPEPESWTEAAKMTTKPEEPYFVGFTVNLRDWGPFVNDLTTEEVGALIKALLAYCRTGERETFEDRALALFFRLQADAVDEQAVRFQDKIKRMR